MNPTVHDICNLFTESALQKIGIFDLNSSKEVFSGTYDDMPNDYNYLEVQSIDLTGQYGSGDAIVFNVEVDE